VHTKPALTSSFRDPAGYLFLDEGVLYRQVNEAGIEDYKALMNSGLYTALIQRGWLVQHEEMASQQSSQNSNTTTALLKPRPLAYISYPYEWCFEQLRDAALLTLDIQILALQHGMSLKDASAFNVQFEGCRPIFIDTLSFERYREGSPWAAYRQFCKHFLAPLALAARRDIRLGKLWLPYIDGIPLDLASKLLPLRSWLSYSLLAHIHFHAMAEKNYARQGASGKSVGPTAKLSLRGLQALLDSLRSAIRKQQVKRVRTEWANYYNETNYSEGAASLKAELVEEFLTKIPGPLKLVQDLGANNGLYSRIAARHAALVVSQDIDPMAVSANYQIAREAGPKNVLPLELDLVTPTPAIGWANSERSSFSQRPPADAILALALIHHLAISNNLPLARIAEFLAQRAHSLIIEFVPKSDSQVAILLATRPDIFPDYTVEGFENAFAGHFHIRERKPIEGCDRILYLMQRQ
jgi:ribosomal protein L11 methylase PrmA